MTNWDVSDLEAAFEQADWVQIRLIEDTQLSELRIDSGQIGRWFSEAEEGERPSYKQHLQKQLTDAQIAEVQTLFERQLANQVVQWQT